MGYRTDKKKKNKPSKNLSEKFRTGWQSRYPVLLFIGGFALLMGVFYGVWGSNWFTTNVYHYIISVYVVSSSMLLNLFGQNTHVSSDIIHSPVFSISIKKGCDAMEAIALFSCALIAFPSKWKAKIIGLAAGISFLIVLNIIRIVSLFLIGVYYPQAFEIMHVAVWQVIFIVLAMVLFMMWIRYALPVKPPVDATIKTHS